MCTVGWDGKKSYMWIYYPHVLGLVPNRDGVNTRTLYSNTNTNTSNYLEYEYEYSEILLIRIGIRILHESIHEYFSLKITFSCR